METLENHALRAEITKLRSDISDLEKKVSDLEYELEYEEEQNQCLIKRLKLLVAAGAIATEKEHKQYYLREIADLLGLRFTVTPVEPGSKPYPDLAGDSDWVKVWK